MSICPGDGDHVDVLVAMKMRDEAENADDELPDIRSNELGLG